MAVSNVLWCAWSSSVKTCTGSKSVLCQCLIWLHYCFLRGGIYLCRLTVWHLGPAHQSRSQGRRAGHPTALGPGRLSQALGTATMLLLSHRHHHHHTLTRFQGWGFVLTFPFCCCTYCSWVCVSFMCVRVCVFEIPIIFSDAKLNGERNCVCVCVCVCVRDYNDSQMLKGEKLWVIACVRVYVCVCVCNGIPFICDWSDWERERERLVSWKVEKG